VGILKRRGIEMKDVSEKRISLRYAKAQAVFKAMPKTIEMIRGGGLPKGDALQVAKIAGIQAAKNTSSIIPYCHPVGITWADISFDLGEEEIRVLAEVKAIDRTGVEMEALTAASAAALTLYDMAKQVDESISLSDIRLLEKRGGEEDFFEELGRPVRTAVLVVSDSVYAGEKEDRAGKAIIEELSGYPVDIVEYKVLPDERSLLRDELRRLADEIGLELILTSGGTGFGPRDITPEATDDILDKDAPGISEAVRAYGSERTPFSALSRGKAGIRGKTLIVNLPGSTRGARESVRALLPWIFHGLKILVGASSEYHAREDERRRAR
jgi:cyclic pyranopterin phosphate synthase